MGDSNPPFAQNDTIFKQKDYQLEGVAVLPSPSQEVNEGLVGQQEAWSKLSQTINFLGVSE